MSSSECLQKIQLYESIKGQVSGISGYVNDCTTSIRNANESISKIIISGKSIDEEKLSFASTGVSGLPEMLSPIILECNSKIEYYNVLYHEALVREAKEMARKRNR